MTLAPPTMIYPGACTCDPQGCVCPPSDLGELMVQAQIAKLRADEARERGDHTDAVRHDAERDRLGARVRAATTPQPASEPAERHTMASQNTTERAEIIAEIQRLSVDLRERHDAAEDLTAKSNAYLGARLESLKERQERERATRTAAVQRLDTASMRATLKFATRVPTDDDFREARNRVFHSGATEGEREALIARVAERRAWDRAAGALYAETLASRLDSLGEPEPNALDRLRAARDLQGRVPLGADRSDAYAAAAHERAIEAHARELAAERVRAEAQEAVRAAMPLPPPDPRLPPPILSNAKLREQADAFDREQRGIITAPLRNATPRELEQPWPGRPGGKPQ